MIEKFSVKLDQLDFDPENPRFITTFDDQTKMFRHLVTDIGVEDLLQSISASGLIDGDPIIVRNGEDERYFVIEGNRRLAALKLLSGERPKDEEPLPPIPKISLKAKKQLESVNVQSGWPADLLQAYLGYKHVTAAREWPPEAKAKFVFEHAGGDYSKTNLTKFAKTLGTTFATLKRWLVAFLILNQAQEAGLFDPANISTKRYFGTFYTLLGGQEAQKFLRLRDDPIIDKPVPKDYLKQLSDFVKWTIGGKGVDRQVNSRQQAKFEQVLASPAALKHFRSRGDLEGSLLYTEYNADEVANKLQEATYSVEDCLPKLFDVRKNRSVKQAFSEFQRAYTKAELNMRGVQSTTPEEE
jgi:hypothetical protein